MMALLRRVLGRIRVYHIRIGVLVYIALMLASNIVHNQRWSNQQPNPPRLSIDIPTTTNAGPVPDSAYSIGYLEWKPQSSSPDMPPIVMLHGSPGGAGAFTELGPLFADAGYRVLAPDLPGFNTPNQYPPSYSILAHAHAVLEFMDAQGIERAHVLGFSMGGGVALHMSDLQPDRVASLIMLSSIGAQEAEGSGDYYFEHGKYAAGMVLALGVRELVPDFGILGPRKFHYTWLRNFWDSDQRPLRQIMESLTTPTLILHGRDDFLVPAWGAEYHHQLIKPSSLVMFDASHFLAFLVTETQNQPQWVADHALPFLERHITPGVEPLRFVADFAPRGDQGISLDALGPLHVGHMTAWWIVCIAIILGTFVSEDATVIAVGVLIARGEIDFFVGLMGCFTGIVIGDGGLWAIGRFAGRRAMQWPVIGKWIPEKSLERWGRWFDSHAIKAVFVARAMPGLRLPTYLAAGLLSRRTATFLFWAAIAAILWTPFLLILASTLGAKILLALEGIISGPIAMITAVAMLLIGLRCFEMLLTWTGRRRLLRFFMGLNKPEFWPVWMFYLPLLPYLLYQSLKYKPMTFSCCNPGISHGGGIVGESKIEILKALHDAGPFVLPAHAIPSMHDALQRAAFVQGIIETDEAFSYPVILKPDESQRGYGMKLAHSAQDVDRYFESMTRPAIMQAYHEGPHELGVLWSRSLEGVGLSDHGNIFSITRKVFPIITGDGVSTLERLIWKHKRFRMQAETFLTRHDDKRDLVLAEGETMRLAIAGCHSQGTRFDDAPELITDALTDRFNTIVEMYQGIPDAQGNPSPIDFGRFDIRYSDEDAIKRGEGFAIVELNGTMSESANLYDPRRSKLWMYQTLFRQWNTMYRIGHRRRQMGVKPTAFRELLDHIREHYQGRSGNAISD